MNRIKCIIIVGILLAVLFSTAYAGDNNHALPYIRMGLGAKALAMGSAFTANADNISAGYWNPAGLTKIENIEIGSMYSANMGMDRTYNYAGIGMKLDFGAIALSWINAGWEDFEGYENGAYTGDFNVQDHNISVSYGREFSNLGVGILRVGATIKTYLQSIDEEMESGFGFDFGAMFQPIDMVSLGLMFRDIAGKLGDDDIPYQGNFGVSVFPTEGVAISADLRNEKESTDVKLCVGGEYVLDLDKLTNFDAKPALRVGLNNNNLTAGIGFMLKMIEVNYAYTADTSEDEIFDDSHRISLLLRF